MVAERLGRVADKQETTIPDHLARRGTARIQLLVEELWDEVGCAKTIRFVVHRRLFKSGES